MRADDVIASDAGAASGMLDSGAYLAPTEPSDPHERAWQVSLRSFMKWAIALSGAVFIVVSLVQLAIIGQLIDATVPAVDGRALKTLALNPAEPSHLEALQWESLMQLETAMHARRSQRINGALMASITASYLGFLTGMILALVGAAFVLGKMREKETTLEGSGGGNKLSLGTSSPGLVLVVLGTVLMLTAQLVHHPIEVEDGSIYMRHDSLSGRSPTADSSEQGPKGTGESQGESSPPPGQSAQKTSSPANAATRPRVEVSQQQLQAMDKIAQVDE